MEKIEEKNKQKIKASQKKELENLNSSITAQSPQLYHQNTNDDGFKNEKSKCYDKKIKIFVLVFIN